MQQERMRVRSLRKDIRDGKQQTIPVSIYATDEANNTDNCNTYILLQDNGGQPGGVCIDTIASLANIFRQTHY